MPFLCLHFGGGCTLPEFVRVDLGSLVCDQGLQRFQLLQLQLMVALQLDVNVSAKFVKLGIEFLVPWVQNACPHDQVSIVPRDHVRPHEPS